MSAHPDRCGGRVRRPSSVDSDHEVVAGGAEVMLTARGRALLDALRDNERFKDVMADPFSEHGTPED